MILPRLAGQIWASTCPQVAVRRLDPVVSEFDHKPNTLCAKARYMELTRLGLALKSVTEQMRKQVQNLE